MSDTTGLWLCSGEGVTVEYSLTEIIFNSNTVRSYEYTLKMPLAVVRWRPKFEDRLRLDFIFIFKKRTNLFFLLRSTWA